MSKYTTELRYICESLAGYDISQDGTKVNDIIESAAPQIFDTNFEIFDENYRLALECKIIKHFYTREIGYETYGLWKLKLNTKMEEIMPLYNQYYKSALLDFNPLYDVDLNREHTNQSEGSTESNSNANRTDVNENKEQIASDEQSNNISGRESKNKDKYSDTPQGAITNLENDTYLTNARIIENKENNVNSNQNQANTDRTSKNNNISVADSNYKDTVKNTNVYIEKVAGKMGGESYSKKLMEFRKSFINTDMMIINDLEELFMQLW